MIKISDIRNMIRNRQKTVIARKTVILKESIEFEKEKAGVRKLQEQKTNISKTHRKKSNRIQKIRKIVEGAGKKNKKEYNPFASQGEDKPFWMSK